MKKQIEQKIKNCQQLNKLEEEKRWRNKLNQIINKMNDARINEAKLLSSDSLRGSQSDPGRKAAARKQPGRYAYKEPRKDVHEKPEFWKK